MNDEEAAGWNGPSSRVGDGAKAVAIRRLHREKGKDVSAMTFGVTGIVKTASKRTLWQCRVAYEAEQDRQHDKRRGGAT
jgi:hypothetical protein